MIVDQYTENRISKFCEYSPEEIGIGPEENNIARMFALTRVLSEREVLSLLNLKLSSKLIPCNLMPLFILSRPFNGIINYTYDMVMSY
jgi:hypothetical protein